MEEDKMTPEQIKKAQNKVKWDKLQAERKAFSDKRDKARVDLGLGESSMMHTYRQNDGSQSYYRNNEERAADNNPYEQLVGSNNAGSSADLWNINNGRERRTWDTTGSPSENGMGAAASTADGFDPSADTSGMFNDINRDTLGAYEQQLTADKNQATWDTAVEASMWDKALNKSPEFGAEVLKWAKENPGAEGAEEILLNGLPEGYTSQPVGGSTELGMLGAELPANASQITGKTWDDMTNGERAAHDIASGNDTSRFSAEDLEEGRLFLAYKENPYSNPANWDEDAWGNVLKDVDLTPYLTEPAGPDEPEVELPSFEDVQATMAAGDSFATGTRLNVDGYIAGMESGDYDTNPQEFFNLVHTMFATDPTAFKLWAEENPTYAMRFHAIAAESSDNVDIFGGGGSDAFGTNDQHVDWDATTASADHNGQNPIRLWGDEAGTWGKDKHLSEAQRHGVTVSRDLLGDETEVDGQMVAWNYKGDYSKDVNNPMSGGDFWKLGTLEKGSDGIGNFVEENPELVIMGVATIAAAGPLIGTQAVLGAGGTVTTAATGLTGVMTGLGVPAAYAGYAATAAFATGANIANGIVSGAEIDGAFLLNAVGTGVITAATAGAIQLGGESLVSMFPSLSPSVANQITATALETVANGGDLEEAIQTGLIQNGVQAVKGAASWAAGEIGGYFVDTAPAEYEDWEGNMQTLPVDPNADDGLFGTGIGGLESPTHGPDDGLEFIDTVEINKLYKIPAPPLGTGVDGVLTAAENYDYNQELDAFHAANPSAPDFRYDSEGVPLPETRIVYNEHGNTLMNEDGTPMTEQFNPVTGEVLPTYDDGQTHNMSVNGGGEFNASDSWDSGNHNWQDYEGPILADGSGPVDPTHPYWTTNQNTNVTVPNNDLSEDGGGGGGGGGSDGAPSTEASPELTDKPLDVQENALSNAPAAGERGDATSYWVDEGGNYVDINDTDYRFGDRWETADGRILYANNDDGMVEYQLFEAVDVAIADGDIDLANGIKSDWESYSGVDFPDGTKLDDYYTGHDDWRGPELTEVSYDDADQYKGDVGAGETPTYPNLDWIPDGNSNEYDPDDILGTSPITTDTTDTTTTTGDTDSYNPYADTDNWGDAEWQKVIDAQGGGGDTSGGGTGGTGVNGTDGVNGQNGNNGDNGTDGNDGEAGVDGKDGKDGTDGKNGGDGGDGFGGGLGSASALIGNGSQAARPGNLFDYDKLSPAAYAILGPLLDQMEHLNR